MLSFTPLILLATLTLTHAAPIPRAPAAFEYNHIYNPALASILGLGGAGCTSQSGGVVDCAAAGIVAFSSRSDDVEQNIKRDVEARWFTWPWTQTQSGNQEGSVEEGDKPEGEEGEDDTGNQKFGWLRYKPF